MTQLTIDNFKTMLTTALANIKAREDEFSKLDAVIGDGDHGQAIVTAMSAIVCHLHDHSCQGRKLPVKYWLNRLLVT